MSWAYLSIYDEFNSQNITKFLILFSIPMVIVDLITLFSVKIYSFEELLETQTLPSDFIERVILPIIPVLILSGIVIGWYFGREKTAVIPAVTVNVFVLIGIGHNLPFTNLVITENIAILVEMKILFYVILVLMVSSYGIILFLEIKLINSKKLNIYQNL